MPLFSVAAARAFDKAQLSNAAKYPDAALTAVADEIAGEFADICGVAFVPTVRTVTLDGAGAGPLLLPDPLVTAVTAANTGAGTTTTALTTAELAALEVDGWGLWWRGGAWPSGGRAVRLTYTHGYATPPPEIVRAALTVAIWKLVPTDIGDRTLSLSSEAGTFRLSTPGERGAFYGLPRVDSVLKRYPEKFAVPRVG